MEGKETTSDKNLDFKEPIFVEEIPKCGRVSMLFFISDICQEKDKLVQLIRDHGGNVALFHECFTHQIATHEDVKHPEFEDKYYRGTVYSSEWITDSIKENKLLPKEKYPLRKLGKGREFEFAKGKLQYTLREVILMYDWIKDKKLKNSKRTWQQMVDQGVIQCRT